MVVQWSPTPPFAKSGAIPTNNMYYIYLLKSKKDSGYYIGFTTRNPKERFVEHLQRLVASTRDRRPLELLYFEAYSDETLAREREQKLKDFGSSYQGLRKRLGF